MSNDRICVSRLPQFPHLRAKCNFKGMPSGGKSHAYHEVIAPVKALPHGIRVRRNCEQNVAKKEYGLETARADAIAWLDEVNTRYVLHRRMVTYADAHRMLAGTRRIMAILGDRKDDPRVALVRIAAGRLADALARTHCRVAVGRNVFRRAEVDGRFQMAARELAESLEGIRDAIVIVVPQPPGSGVRVHYVSQGGNEPTPRRRGKGLGGIRLRRLPPKCSYRVLPDHETIVFLPLRDIDKDRGTYKFPRAQKEAVCIVNGLLGGLASGKDERYVAFTNRDANILRSANLEFLEDCVERKPVDPLKKRGNGRWENSARLRVMPKTIEK